MLLAGDINRVDDPTGLTSVEVYNRKRKKWVFSSKIEVKNLILWAGDIPKDTLTENNKSKWSSINTHLVMGQQDPLINDKMKAKFLNETPCWFLIVIRTPFLVFQEPKL